MSSVVIAGDTSGSVTLSAPSVAGTTTLTLPSTSGTVVATGVSSNIDINAAGSNSLSLSTNSLARLSIDSSGRILKPYQPVFAIYDLTFATGTAGVGTGGTVSSNVGSCYNSSNGRFTAPVSGNYLFNLSIQAFNSGSTTYIDVGLRVNNSSNIGSFPFGYGGTYNNHTQVNGMVIVYLNANDFAQIYAYYGARSGGQNTFNGFLIG